mmetsp:Transcript_40552/g.94833  ORF Transcript_40552/g.94833 Transcript_40552/m.94833 type:complete len:288 (+) Transcript_40552:1601-2464(+)
MLLGEVLEDTQLAAEIHADRKLSVVEVFDRVGAELSQVVPVRDVPGHEQNTVQDKQGHDGCNAYDLFERCVFHLPETTHRVHRVHLGYCVMRQTTKVGGVPTMAHDADDIAVAVEHDVADDATARRPTITRHVEVGAYLGRVGEERVFVCCLAYLEGCRCAASADERFEVGVKESARLVLQVETKRVSDETRRGLSMRIRRHTRPERSRSHDDKVVLGGGGDGVWGHSLVGQNKASLGDVDTTTCDGGEGGLPHGVAERGRGRQLEELLTRYDLQENRRTEVDQIVA